MTVRAPRRRSDVAASFVVRAAAAAPSVCNSQPWYFSSRQNAIRLHADPRRRLPQADPAGREMVISCGAALFNLRLAMSQLGFAADVTLLPDPSHPDLLAEVRWGSFTPPAPGEEALYRSIPLRHTHRGPFTAGMPPALALDLVRVARQEQAELRVIYDTGLHRPLAGLIHAAEFTQRTCPRLAAERVRWVRPPDDPRLDGVPTSAYPVQPDGLEFATRDFACGTGWGHAVGRRPDSLHALGVVALLSVREDRRLGWLLAGQALQRLLLHATAHGVGAAFHTQPLELPWTRERIRTEFTGGAYPQMLLRLGCGGHSAATPRRPVADMLSAEN
jgi:hypothetical protein